MRKDERELDQMKDFTFKPKINSNHNIDLKKGNETKEKRIERLYKKGL